MQKDQKFLGDVWLGFHILCWASFPILINISAKTLPPLFYAGTSFLVAGCIGLLTLGARNELRNLLPKDGLKYMTISTFLVIGIVFSFRFIGGQITNPGNMALLSQTKLIFTMLFFGLLGIEQVSKKRIAGATLVGIGAMFVLWNNFSGTFNQGDLAILIACAFVPIANFYQKKALMKVSSFTHLCFRSLFGGIFVLGLSFAFEGKPTAALFTNNLWLIVTNGLLVLWISQVAFLEALKRLDVSRIMTIVGINPGITMCLAYLLLDISPTTNQLIGFCFILLGVNIGRKS